MKTQQVSIAMMTLVIVFGTTFVTGSEPSNYEGEAYLKTVNPITRWNVRNGIVVTGLSWFDQLSQQYIISNLREVDISCQISLNYYHITFDQTFMVDQVCNAFEQETEVVQAWPVIVPEWLGIPDDPNYSNQWGLVQIDAAPAWDYESGNSSVIIGILDTGAEVEYDADPTVPVHPDLENNLWNDNGLYGIDLFDIGTAPDDGFGHGTHVSGIAGSVTNNTIGIAGVAGGGFGSDDGVSLLIVRNGRDDGYSNEEYFAESICQALNPDGDWNTDDWVDIINMSWGLRRSINDLPPSCEGAFPILRTAVEEASYRGVVMIAGAGNSGSEFDEQCVIWPYPAGYDEVIAVAATGPDDEHLGYSNQGSFIEVAAPGGVGFIFTNLPTGHGIEYDEDDIYSTFPRDLFTLQDPQFWSTVTGYNIVETNITNEYGYLSGTSMASPYVAGLIGLVLSRFPSFDVTDVRNLLKSSAEKVGQYYYDENGWNKYLGYGRINAFYAIAPPSIPQDFTVIGDAGDNPTLQWLTNTEPDLAGYNLYKDEGQGWLLMTTVDKSINSYTDYSVIIGQGYKFTPNVCYRISSFDITNQESPGSFPRCKPLGGVSKTLAGTQNDPIPEKFALLPAYPNPFNPSTSIRYQLKSESHVELRVYNVMGGVVLRLVSDLQNAGYYDVSWDGLDDNGRYVSSGTYIVSLRVVPINKHEVFTDVRKVVLLH